MTAARAIPAHAHEPMDSANARLKSKWRVMFSTSFIAATLLHFVAFAYSPEFKTQDVSFTSEELKSLEIPPDVEIPPPPQAIARPATPIMASSPEFDQDLTIAPTTFVANPVSELPPPPEREVAVIHDEEQPRFTPFTVAPTITNRDELRRAMIDSYPPMLRSAGIGGIVQVFFFIDTEGMVKTAQISVSSGYEALDQAALSVANLYRFSPALNRDQKVEVWVALPIEFKVSK